MATAPALDEKTATAIRRALTAVQAGQLAEARRIGEQALANGGDPIALNAMLGGILCGSGRFEDAIRHLRTAHEARPEDPVIAANLATALCQVEDFASAFAVATEDLARADKTFRVQRIRGFAAHQVGDYLAAVTAQSAVVEASPSDWEAWNNLGNALLAAEDYQGGVGALRRAAEINPAAAPVRINLCRALRHAGKFEEAEAQLRAMADDFPSDGKPLVDLAVLLRDLGREDSELIAVLERALAREPANVEARIELARKYADVLAMDDSERMFRSILELEPSGQDAFLGLMVVYETHRPGALDSLAAEAEAGGAGQACSNLIRAFADRRAKRYREGLAALEAVPQDYEPAHRAQVEGQLLDALGEYDAAFASFTRMNEAHLEDGSRPLERAEEWRSTLRGQIESTTADWVQRWAAPAIPSSRPAPVFLVGFPRSGTTLLDTMLMGHPDVEVMEEKPVLGRIEHELGSYEAVADMHEDQVRAMQDRYFEIASGYAPLREGTLLVDKAPLSLNRAALIHRLFPGAKVILALRHPADVVLSCFMANFRLNSSMCNFLRLDTAAEFYDLTFSMWEKSRSLLPLDVHEIRYENVVEDAERELRPLVEGLGLDWNADVLDHQRTAGNRGVISTASYAQVTQPIYRGAVGRWERYRKHLEPVLPVLAPWADKFGYAI